MQHVSEFSGVDLHVLYHCDEASIAWKIRESIENENDDVNEMYARNQSQRYVASAAAHTCGATPPLPCIYIRTWL